MRGYGFKFDIFLLKMFKLLVIYDTYCSNLHSHYQQKRFSTHGHNAKDEIGLFNCERSHFVTQLSGDLSQMTFKNGCHQERFLKVSTCHSIVSKRFISEDWGGLCCVLVENSLKPCSDHHLSC